MNAFNIINCKKTQKHYEKYFTTQEKRYSWKLIVLRRSIKRKAEIVDFDTIVRRLSGSHAIQGASPIASLIVSYCKKMLHFALSHP